MAMLSTYNTYLDPTYLIYLRFSRPDIVGSHGQKVVGSDGGKKVVDEEECTKCSLNGRAFIYKGESAKLKPFSAFE